MAALGSDDVSVKSDAEEAEVTLTIDGEKYSRELTRADAGGITSSGEPLLDDPELAELFAFLLRSNEARLAVVQQDDLRDIIMRPVDTQEIDRQIEQTRSQRDEIDSELDTLDELEDRLPSLQEDYEKYNQRIEAQKEKREELKRRIGDADANIEESKEEQAETERKLGELQELRSDLEDVRYRIETEEDSIESLEQEEAELEAELESLTLSVQDISELSEEIDRLQQQKEKFDSTLDQVRNVVQFNQEMLDEGAAVQDFLDKQMDQEGALPTDQLLPEDERNVVCWTCGSNVARDDISSMLDELQDVSSEIMEMRREVKSDLEDRRQEKKEIESKQNRRNQITNQLSRIEQEIEKRTETLSDLRAEKESLTEEISSLEAEVENTQNSDYQEVLDLHKEANEVELEIERLQESRDETGEQIEEIESKLDDYDDLVAEREQLNERLTELRTKIDRLEQSAVESFNEHMDEVLQLLDYENIERIWIERKETEVRKGRRKVSQSVFDLHITRSSESGTVFRDTVDNLSESEREVTGLVFALSGYLAHKVYEEVPFILLDSLEAIDAERIATLVEYFEEYADYLVVALLEEDARAVTDYNEIAK
jgi:chromosome segregation ATPase